MYQYKIKKINRVIDGDTVDLDIDLGFNITLNHRVRFKGINAAEIHSTNLDEKKKGINARLWLEKELAKEGDWIIETDKDKDDKYGRILGTLYYNGNPVSVNQKMLDEGIAVKYL